MIPVAVKPKGATSYKETKFGIIPRSKLLKLELAGIKKSLDFIHQLITKDKDSEITPELILKLHRQAFGWIFPKWAGKYRKIRVTISGKEAPESYHIPEMVTNLCEDLKVRLKHLPNKTESSYIFEVVKLLAWFQHRFVFIHPFNDYNGRTGRVLTILLMLRLGLPPAEIQVETDTDRKRYIAAMQHADEGNISDLESIIGKTLLEGLKQGAKTKKE